MGHRIINDYSTTLEDDFYGCDSLSQRFHKKPNKIPICKHVNFSTNASVGKTSSSNSSEKSKSSVSKILKDVKSKKFQVNLEPEKDVSSDEVSSEPETSNSAPENLYDIMDETNNDILAFLSDMHIQGEYQPNIDELLADSSSGDENFEENIVCHKKPKKCHCNCHKKVQLCEHNSQNCNVKEIKAPPGTNITIPIYAAASNPPNQNFTPRLVWPPNESLFCPSRQKCHSNQQRSNWKNTSACQSQQKPKYLKQNSRSFPCSTHLERRKFTNQCNDCHEEVYEEPRNYSDTLNFDTEFDVYNDNNNTFYNALDSNRLNRIGSPMNWEEIFKYLD